MPRPPQCYARWARQGEARIDKPSGRYKGIQLETVRSVPHSADMPQRVVVATRNWRIVMISFNPGKTLGRLMLISAAILLHANGALAAQLVEDPQMQADDLLSGTFSGRAKIVDVSPAVPAGGRHRLNPD